LAAEPQARVVAYSINPRSRLLFETQIALKKIKISKLSTNKLSNDSRRCRLDQDGATVMGINTLAFIASLSFLVGALLALRWNVLVLVPAIGAALLIVALIGAARGEDAGSLAVEMMVTVTCIEAGYVARLIAYALADASRIAIAAATAVRLALRERSSPSLPGLTRQSILFASALYEEDGPAGQARG
jgi:hypothetical protein